jgi:hypothetical protein
MPGAVDASREAYAMALREFSDFVLDGIIPVRLNQGKLIRIKVRRERR